MNTPARTPTNKAVFQLRGRANPTSFQPIPRHRAKPTQQKKVRGLAEKDVVVYIGDKQ
jgi:hypothetical protein